jgi:TRAP-type C4-dicarboxylate transport system permease small subunit
MDALGALIVLGMMIIVNIDVFGRWLFDSPLAGTFELTEMGIVAVVYLQLAHTIRVKRLTRSDTFLNFLARVRGQAADQSLRLVFNLAGALMLGIIAFGQFPRFVDAWTKGYYKGNVGIFTAPTWPLEGIMLLGAVAAAIQFLVLACRNAKALRGR